MPVKMRLRSIALRSLPSLTTKDPSTKGRVLPATATLVPPANRGHSVGRGPRVSRRKGDAPGSGNGALSVAAYTPNGGSVRSSRVHSPTAPAPGFTNPRLSAAPLVGYSSRSQPLPIAKNDTPATDGVSRRGGGFFSETSPDAQERPRGIATARCDRLSAAEVFHVDRHSAILDLCGITEEVLFQIPLRAAASRDDYFSTGNLWSLEIESTCSQMIQYHRGVWALINQGLSRPAATLARSIHEACFRFKYLAENEHELKDWAEWQIGQDYQFARDSLQHDVADDDTEIRRSLEGAMEGWEHLLGGPPRRRPHPWRSTSEIFRSVEEDVPHGRGKGLRRHLIGLFSGYVHLRRTVEPPPELTLSAVDFSVLLTIRRAMVLCLEKELLPLDASEQASEIVQKCEKLLDPRFSENG